MTQQPPKVVQICGVGPYDLAVLFDNGELWIWDREPTTGPVWIPIPSPYDEEAEEQETP